MCDGEVCDGDTCLRVERRAERFSARAVTRARPMQARWGVTQERPAIDSAELQRLHDDLRRYIGWSPEDARRLSAVAGLLKPHFEPLVDDFYLEIARHPVVAEVLQSHGTPVAQLKLRLRGWLVDMFTGQDRPGFAARRWQIGWRHVEMGVSQVYVNMAMARLRLGLNLALHRVLADQPQQEWATIESLNKALDLDLAIIQHAFELEQLRRKTEAARMRSEIRFRNLVEAATCLIVILRQDGATMYFSPFAETLTGISAQHMCGQDFFNTCVPSGSREQARQFFCQAAQGGPCQPSETPVVGHDGQLRWLAWNARRMDDMDGEPVVLLVGHDITERREAEQRLVQAERLAAIGQMITGLAHESRNALQRVHASSEMLEFELEGNATALEWLHRSQKAIDDIRRLFDEVRNYAGPLHLERHRQAVDSIWREAWDLLVHLRRDREVVLEEVLQTHDATADVDRFRLVQVFRNLLENSLSACPDPVRIRIACRRVHRAEVEMLEIEVSDNGPGFSPEAKREAFDPFFTTKTKGTGLGLAIVQRTVQAHGGIVALDAAETSNIHLPGARVWLYLPIRTPDEGGAKP